MKWWLVLVCFSGELRRQQNYAIMPENTKKKNASLLVRYKLKILPYFNSKGPYNIFTELWVWRTDNFKMRRKRKRASD